MGVWDWLFGGSALNPDGTVTVGDVLAPPYPSVQAQIDAYVAERMSGGPLVLPAVERGVELLSSAVAQLNPIAYRDGKPLPAAPAIIERPDPWATRYAFLEMTVRSMVETGDAFWYLFRPDPETGKPRSARVLPSSEVEVSWDDKRFLPLYKWRGQKMTIGVDIAHIPLAPRVGELRGVSPLVACEQALEALAFAELYAAGWFAGSGIPSGVLSVPTELDDGEADRLKARWLAAHAGPVPTPAVLSGGMTWAPEAANPQDSQLTESREHGVATVARLLGIPAPLLLVSSAGSSITYANVSQLYAELHRSTVIPLYLSPLESALSDLTPRGTIVRFDLGELQRLDVTARWEVYTIATQLGVIGVEDVAAREGLPPPGAVPTPFAPSVAPAPAIEAPEVPAA